MARNSEFPDHRGPKARGEVLATCLVMSFLILTAINTLAIVALALFN